MFLSNRATDMTIQWIYNNGYQFDFKKAQSVEILKKAIATRLGPLTENMVKGLRLANWDAIYKLIQNS